MITTETSHLAPLLCILGGGALIKLQTVLEGIVVICGSQLISMNVTVRNKSWCWPINLYSS